jgi:enoyl-[acyl-carrier protein] reductase II
VVINLASAVSNAGGLGLIGAGYPGTREHIQKKNAKSYNKAFGRNPMLYPNIEEIMKIIVDEGENCFYIGGNLRFGLHLKENGITVVHVVSSAAFALKATKCR